MSAERICSFSGEPFTVSSRELDLRKKWGVPDRTLHPRYLIRELLAYWPHFSLYRRLCDHSRREIVSVYDEHCPYPVWHREDWLKHADPPSARFDPETDFFDQLWRLFPRCPIPHNTGHGNENCEYTDDWWYSKNCYLSHSGLHVEDSYYCYRVLKLKDCQYCVFSWEAELCRELVNSRHCFNVLFGVKARSCRDSAFLFDCRNCEHCLFCWNLRNKKYCIENKEYSKDEYFKKRAEYDFSSRQSYERAKEYYRRLMFEKAYWRALESEHCQDSTGAYIERDNRCDDCFFLDESEDCINCFRGYAIKSSLDCISGFRSELIFCSSLAQDLCYDVRYCSNVIQCRYLEYSAHCYNCEHCFGCSGLVNKKYCILNKQYDEKTYPQEVGRIKETLMRQGVYGQFFPGHFSASAYEDTLAHFYFPLPEAEQKSLGFRVSGRRATRPKGALDANAVPDSAHDASFDSLKSAVFWDAEAERPFQVKEFDLAFSKKTGVPLPSRYYIEVVKDLFRLLPYEGGLRPARCALSGRPVMTNLPKSLDGRILSEEAYLESLG